VFRETLVWWVGGVVHDNAIESRGQRWPYFQVFSSDTSFKLQCLYVSSFNFVFFQLNGSNQFLTTFVASW
jgi:hypothetical protein